MTDRPTAYDLLEGLDLEPLTDEEVNTLAAYWVKVRSSVYKRGVLRALLTIVNLRHTATAVFACGCCARGIRPSASVRVHDQDWCSDCAARLIGKLEAEALARSVPGCTVVGVI